MKLDSRIVTRLFGKIAPKRGDLVFVQTSIILADLQARWASLPSKLQ